MIKSKHILKFFANASLLVFAFATVSLSAAVTDWSDISHSNQQQMADWPPIRG